MDVDVDVRCPVLVALVKSNFLAAIRGRRPPRRVVGGAAGSRAGAAVEHNGTAAPREARARVAVAVDGRGSAERRLAFCFATGSVGGLNSRNRGRRWLPRAPAHTFRSSLWKKAAGP